MKKLILLLALITLSPLLAADDTEARDMVFASKLFTENIILAEIATQLVTSTGLSVSHQASLGGSRILWSALLNGEIDAYPEYSGTLFLEILAREKVGDIDELRALLQPHGLGATGRLGFNNTYIIGMLEDRAAELGITKVSDLQAHPQLKFAFSNEFMDRADGWYRLRDRYQLPQLGAVGLEHDLAYRALESKDIDAMDLYSTDAEIPYYKIRALEDDLSYFPDYHALFLYRLDAPESMISILHDLEDKITNSRMVSMNAAVKLEGMSEPVVAAAFIEDNFQIKTRHVKDDRLQRFWQNTRNHLGLVGISLFAAICLAIPLGIVAARYPLAGQFILGLSGILQTIPSLALFVFMIPLLGIGAPPTIAALFVYSLLPIIRNTCSGLQDIPREMRESAQVIGLSPHAILRQIELPLATRSILAGIKTSAVINVGTATLGAFIGAGGYGQPILTGIRLDDSALILEGAIPAAVLALLVQYLFEFIERRMLPAPLRYQPGNSKQQA